jgi:uncharacterized membrane protein HdeD (DUF308 family)
MTTDVRGMGQIAAKYWWVILVRGIILILLGMAMLIWPKQSLQVFGIIFVAYLFVDGVMSIFQGFSARKQGQSGAGDFVVGALAIIAGIVILVWPQWSVEVLAYLVAFWALLAGISGIAGGLALRKQPGSGWGWFVAWGVLALVFGIIVLFNPAAGILSILWLVAIWAIMAGIIFAIASFFVRKAGNVIVRQTAG